MVITYHQVLTLLEYLATNLAREDAVYSLVIVANQLDNQALAEATNYAIDYALRSKLTPANIQYLPFTSWRMSLTTTYAQRDAVMTNGVIDHYRVEVFHYLYEYLITAPDLAPYVQMYRDYYRSTLPVTYFPNQGISFGLVKGEYCQAESLIAREPFREGLMILAYGTPGDYNCLDPDEFLQYLTNSGLRNPYGQGEYYSVEQLYHFLRILVYYQKLTKAGVTPTTPETVNQIMLKVGSKLELLAPVRNRASTDPEGVRRALTQVFDLGMYLRRWCGVRGNYPLSRADTKKDWSEVIPPDVLEHYRAEHGNVDSETAFNLFIGDKISAMMQTLATYPEVTAIEVNTDQNLGSLIYGLETGACVRMTSQPLVIVAYNALKRLGMTQNLGVTDEDIDNLDSIDYVPQGERESGGV